MWCYSASLVFTMLWLLLFLGSLNGTCGHWLIIFDQWSLISGCWSKFMTLCILMHINSWRRWLAQGLSGENIQPKHLFTTSGRKQKKNYQIAMNEILSMHEIEDLGEWKKADGFCKAQAAAKIWHDSKSDMTETYTWKSYGNLMSRKQEDHSVSEEQRERGSDSCRLFIESSLKLYLSTSEKDTYFIMTCQTIFSIFNVALNRSVLCKHNKSRYTLKVLLAYFSSTLSSVIKLGFEEHWWNHTSSCNAITERKLNISQFPANSNMFVTPLLCKINLKYFAYMSHCSSLSLLFFKKKSLTPSNRNITLCDNYMKCSRN